MVGGGAPAITTGIFPGCWTACAVGAGCSMPTTVPERTTGSCWTTVPVATGWLPSAWYCGLAALGLDCSPCSWWGCRGRVLLYEGLRSKAGENGRKTPLFHACLEAASCKTLALCAYAVGPLSLGRGLVSLAPRE